MSRTAPRTRDMTSGSPTRHILVFAVPILLGNLLQQFYSLVDTIVIGRIEGVTAQAAVSSAGWLDWAILSLAMGLAQGFGIAIAQHFGAGDLKRLHRAEGQSIVLSVISTLVLLAASQVFLPAILHLMQTPQETFQLTQLYLRIIFAGLPVVMGYNLLSGFLRSVGDSRTPLIAMVASALVNVALDVWFVAGFRWSVTGVAVATTAAQAISFVICLIAMFRLPVMHIQRQDLHPNAAEMTRLMKLATPIAMQNGIISVGGLVLQGVVNGFGLVFMAGYSAASKLQGLVELSGVCISTAVGTFTGQNFGAGRMDRVKQGLRASVILSTAFALITAAAMILWGHPLLRLFMEDDPAMVDQVLTIGYRFLVIMGIGLWWLYMLFVYRSTLQGMGETFSTMLSGIVELFMRLASVLLLPLLIGEWGVYLAEIMAWVGAAVWLAASYYIKMRRLAQKQRAALDRC